MFKKILFTLFLAILGWNAEAQTTYFIDQVSSPDTVGILYDQGGATNNYNSNSNAVFTITPNNGKEVKIQFRDFDIEPGETSALPREFWLCEYDNVTVFDGADTNATSLGVFCGSELPSDLESTSGSLTIQLKADGGTEGRGFDIYWTTGELPVLPPPPASTGYCSATGFDCDTINGPFDETDIISKVNLTNVTNSSICSANGYADYSHKIAVVAPGSQAQLAVNIDGPGGIPGGVYAWLDTNQDSVFTDDEEIIMVGDVGVEYFTDEPFIGIINAPAEALGLMRLRIRVNGNQAPCGAGDGEVEDYTVFVGDTIIGGGSGYCDASSNVCDRYISNVLMNEIDNTSICTPGGYTDYSDQVALIPDGGQAQLQITTVFSNFASGVFGWIDYNNDMVFGDDEIIPIVGNGAANLHTAVITAPPGVSGAKRMRLKYTTLTGNTDACGLTELGETEDYTVFFGAPLACISNPSPVDGAIDVCVSNGTLIWDSVPGATNYRFSMLYNNGSGDVVVAQSVELSDTSFTTALVANSTYKWIAIPYNDGSEALACDTLTFTTTANGNPIVDIVETNIEICAGNTYSITANITDGNAPITFVWTDANNQLDRTDSSVVVFQDNTPGIYKFYVSVSDDKGCAGNMDSVTVEVNSGAVAGDFTIADTNACFGAPIVVNWINQFGADTIQVSSDNLVFNDADSVVQNGEDFSVFLNPGVYFLRGRVDAGAGCTDHTNSIEVVINADLDQPMVDYVSGNEACQGDEVFVLVNNYSDNITWNNDPSLTDNPYGVSKTSDNVATYTDPVTGCVAVSEPISVIINATPAKPILVCDGIALGTDMAVATYEWYKNGILLPQFVGSVIEYDKDESFYNAIAVTDKGCKSPLSDTVFMPSPASITYHDVNLTADAVGSYYRWYLNGAEITGETAQTLAHNKVEGTYIVEVFNDQDCASAISDEFVLSTVGVTTHFTSENVSVYPNPSNGKVNVFVANSLEEALTVSITDVSGKIIHVNDVAANEINTTIQVNNLEAGLYIVAVASANQSIQLKLIVE
jgi:hypothetical protein